MNNFVNKASLKLEKLSDEQIRRVFSVQQKQLDLCNDIFNCIDAGFIVVSKDTKLSFVNKYAAEILQFDLSAFKPNKTSLREIIINSEMLSFLLSKLEHKSDEFEHSFDYKHSILGPIKLHVKSFTMQCGTLLVVRDITILDKFKREFQKNESLASMTTMAAGIAHEIKNPLAAMSIYLQLLNKQIDKKGSITKEEATKSLSIIGEEIERLNSMAVDFLFAVKPMNIHTSIQNINTVVTKSCNIIQTELDSLNIKLFINLASSLPKVSIDENLIEQCILNLVRNAMQAIETGKDGEIEVSTYMEGNFVVLSVSDNGIGMSDTQLTRIFEPYYTTKASGTGLGLTTIFKIVKEHSGEINVDSHVGRGSVFTIKIPVPHSERFKIKD